MEIYELQQIPENLLDKVGGKAKGLSLLKKYSFNVPNGFILIDVKNEEDFNLAADYYEKMNLGEVAVRSSATIEDGVNYSNAGQYETILNVSGRQKFITAVKDCIASLGNFRSQKYSKMFLNSNENKMTVVVQQMVNAKCAGVLFTKDPLDSSCILIECVAGLGESLVSGTQTAEQFRVKDGKMLPTENKLLTEKQVLELYEASLGIEKSFGMPMDVEWAINEKNELCFLQARPITVVEDDGVNINEFDFPHDVTGKTITTCNVREMLSTAVTPLSMSTSVFCLDYGMRKMMAKNHSIKKIDDLPPFSCITPFYNNMFFNQSTNYINAYRIAGTAKETSDIVICGRVLEDFPDNFADYSSNFMRAFRLIYFLPYVLSGKKSVKGINQVLEKLHFNFDDSLEGLYQQAQDNFYLLEDAFFYHYCSSYFSGACSMMAVKKLNIYHEDLHKIDALLSGSLTNIEGIEGAKIIDKMKELAGEILKADKNATKFTTQQLADFISSSTGAVKESYDNFMKLYGHRGINETEMRVDCWEDNLNSFCDSLKGVIVSYNHDEKHNTKDWTEYLEEILAPVPKKKQKSIKSLIIKARLGAWNREYTKARSIYVVAQFRKIYRLIAEKLMSKSLLPDKDLIYFLTKEEIGALIKGDKSLIKKAMKRRRLYPVQCSLKFEEVYSGKPIPIEEVAVEGKTDFQGIPASPGLVTGKARIIRSIDDANQLQAGEIMVAACTDVGWTPYYCLAQGLITEIGSCLSHGVVVAREYGLPTIVNARGIMQSIKNGDVITMDGSKGTVTLVSEDK